MEDLPVIKAEGRVLSTLESDGSRRWLRPKLSMGRFWHRRRIVAYALIAIYTLLPFIKINGRQTLQLDIWNAEFSFFGLLLLPTDLELLALGGLIVFLTIFFATAIFGRIWCGWACPQTVYMEYLIRPLERLFTGTSGKGGKPKKEVAGWRVALLYVVYVIVCWHLANTFLSYFVGAETVHSWIWNTPPWHHPGAFTLVLFVTGLMLFDFCYWREQLCIIGCPYGRFQSVLLDKSSLIVGYDYTRGEPRGRGRDRASSGLGDCVDCNMCVDVCPTGIDIRDGLQLECVNCTQCIDACNAVMDRVNKPRGLIRYCAQSTLDGKVYKFTRPRVIIYGVALLCLSTLFLTFVASQKTMDVTLLRGLGSPFLVNEQGEVDNLIRVIVVNRTDQKQTYSITVSQPEEGSSNQFDKFDIEPGESVTQPIHVGLPQSLFISGNGIVDAVIEIADGQGEQIEMNYRLFGPATTLNQENDES